MIWTSSAAWPTSVTTRRSPATRASGTADGKGLGQSAGQAARPPPQVGLADLLDALRDVLARAELFGRHHIRRETLSVRERMSQVLERLDALRFTPFTALFRPEEGRMGVVVTLLAVLELLRESLLELVQAEPFAPIHVRRRI